MKISLILFLSTIYSSLIIASPTPRDSWHFLRVSPDVLVLQPNLPISVFNACSSGDEIRTINPIKKCLDYAEKIIGSPAKEIGFYKYECTNYELVNMSFPREHEERVCLKNANSEVSNNECIRYKNINKTYPETYKLDVVALNNEQSLQHLFYKEFKLPQCL